MDRSASRTQPDIVRRESQSFRLAHCILPAWSDAEIDSATEQGSIGIAFTGQDDAIVRETDGVARRRPVPAGSIGLGGNVPIVWLKTTAPCDIIEITGADALRLDVARDMGVENHANLDDLHGWCDSLIHAVGLRLRAALRGWTPMSDMEGETLVRAAFAQALRLHFGGRDGVPRSLDARRRGRVLELIYEGSGSLSLNDLADAAALSPYHFARSFTRSFGMPPHRFVTLVRLEQALDVLRTKQTTVRAAATQAGFHNLHHFRRIFQRQYGVLPSQIRHSGKSARFEPYGRTDIT